ncbi:MAG: type II toxin-antitoxin system RelE/ParE family toxin [Methylococcaceae bacterium]|nr:type II toxin-antitoxin system RelE/ParE family toxin [Methylococcaceae bacterium]
MSGYVFSKEAENDLIEIYRYGFLEHGVRKAEIYQQSLKAKCEFLSCNPKLNREREEFTPPVRIHPHKEHLIIYLIEEDYILILRVLYKKMDIPNHLEN